MFKDDETETIKVNLKAKSIPVDLRSDGILWLINRSIFHPRGFALGLNEDGTFCLMGTGLKTWSFDERTENARFDQIQRMFKRAREHNQEVR